MTRVVLTLSLCLLSAAIPADRLVTTSNGDEIPVTVYAAEGEQLILWLSSEFGATKRRTALAAALAANGIEIWAPDLHAAWFLPVGRYSLNDVDPAAIDALIAAAIRASGKDIFVMAEGRTAALALAGVRQWQQADSDTGRLRGLLAFSPKLYVRTPQGGEAAEYLPVVAASNLPIYLLQPEDSAAVWRLGDTVRELEKGGAKVFVHRLRGVSDGFYARPVSTPAELALTGRLPVLLSQAMDLLDALGGTPPQAPPLTHASRAPERPTGSALLRPYAEERQAPALKLAVLGGGMLDLADLRGRVVLVNFWTTWCPPCVEEIPSLQRLHERLNAKGLEILAVDVGESEATLRAFLADKPIDFPVLMDGAGEALRRWGVYAFPTTLILDRAHRVRFAVFGAFDWSSDEVIDTLIPLLLGGD